MAHVLITINGEDHSTRAFQEARDGFKSLSTAALALGPAMAPVAAAATAAIAGLASTLGGAAVAAGAFKLAVQPQIGLMQEHADAAKKVSDAQETAARKQQVADKLAAQGSSLAEKAQKAATSAKLAAIDAEAAYKRETAGLPRATADSALALAKLKNEYQAWSDKLAGNTMPVFTKGINILRTILPTLTPIVQNVSKVFDGLMGKLQKKVESKGFEDFMKKVADWSAGGLKKTIDAIGFLYTKISGFVMSEGFKQFLSMGNEAGGDLVTVFKNLARFAMEFFKAAGPLAGLSFKALGFLADALNAIPQSVLEILAPTIMAIVVAVKAWRLAVLAYTAAQWLMNAAMTANPIGLIIVAVVALVAAIWALWNKNEGFRKAMIAAWNAIKDGVVAAWNWLKNNVITPIGNFFTKTIPGWASTLKQKVIDAWNAIKKFVGDALSFLKNLFLNWTGPGLIIKHWDKIKNAASTVVNKIKEFWNSFMSFFRGIPGKIASAASGMWNGIKNSFRSAVNWIIDKWNNLSFTIGGGSIFGKKIPSLTLSTPNIPHLARGGIASGLAVVGERGRELVNLPSGSHVRSAADTGRLLGGSGEQRIVLEVNTGGGSMDKWLGEMIRRYVRVNGGGSVQTAFGRN